MKKLTTALAIALLATACTNAPGTVDQTKRVSVRGAVVVPAEAYKLMTAERTRVPFELRRLSKIEVWVDNTEDLDPAFEAGELLPLGSGDADHTFDDVVLTDLQPFTTYTVQLKAYQYDPAVDAVIQVDVNDQGESETTFNTDGAGLTDAANEEVVLASGFKLTLADQDFAGLALGGNLAASTTDGLLNGPSGSAHVAALAQIAGFEIQLYDTGTGDAYFDADLRIYDEGSFANYHTINACGSGHGCADADTYPTAGTFAFTPSPSGLSERTFTVKDPGGTLYGTFSMTFDWRTGVWTLGEFDSQNASFPDMAMRKKPGI